MASNAYVFSDPTKSQIGPFLYYDGASTIGQDVTVLLDDVFATPPSNPITSGPFTLSPSKANPKLPWQVVAPAKGGIWDFSSAASRKAVRDGFDGLFAALNEPGGAAPALKAGRRWLIRGYLAEGLPQTFPETLYYRYGLDADRRCVDVTPGMRLRVDYQQHQQVDPEASDLNGFVGAGSTYIDVGVGAQSGNILPLAFDPFLGSLGGMTVSASTGGGGGSIDLQGAAWSMPYWRLIYPQTYPAAAGTGFATAQQNPALLGAPSQAGLEEATTNYLSGQPIADPAVAAFFRGRVAVVPEVPVFVQGQLEHVALGTTFRALLAGLGPIPWLDPGLWSSGSGAGVYSRRRTLFASTGGWKIAGFAGVDFANSYERYGDCLDAMDLPVLGGDVLALTTSAAT
ncbi:MAG: hypothetical protein ACRDPC_01320 [Solirubrobacteraceae bacterium]